MYFRIIRISTLSIFSFFASLICLAQPGNDAIAGATTILPVTTCGAITNQTLYNATSDNIGSSCGSGTRREVWYKFTTPAYVTAVSISVSGRGSSLNNTNSFIEAYNAQNDAEVIQTNTLGCGNSGTTLNVSGLTQNTEYYFRVFTNTAPTTTPSTNWNFSICVSYTAPTAPANNECSTPTTLTLGSAASGTVWGATASSSIPTDCITGTPDDDVWYRFTASSANINVDLSGIGSNLSAAGAMLQLFGGSCGSLTSLACGYKSLSAGGLNSGSIYYIRVYSSDATSSIGGIASGSAFSITASSPSTPTSSSVSSSRMNEVFQQTILSPANALSDPWEVTYGPDGYIWITEAKGYRVFRMDPVTGLKSTILDISQNSTFLPAAERTFNLQFDIAARSFQGGLAGLALHPDWASNKFVYLSYGHTYNSTAANSGGVFFTNRIVRFEYDPVTNRLKNPISICDTLPGSSDHNSQRLIIAPVGGTNYLFYAAGDMGAGQFGNARRPIKAQNPDAYEGKILRFNLDSDGDGGLDAWIPDDNPYNTTSPAKQSAVWCIGIRNNQGFVYANGKLYGSSHGAYSDDEINIIEPSKNYGHPLVIGKADGNYNNGKAGHDNGADATILPLIVNEVSNAAGLVNYTDPIFSFYPAPAGNNSTPSSIQFILNNQSYTSPTYSNPGAALSRNQYWWSEAPSGLDFYNNTVIPGWKNSLVNAALKWGRLMRLKLNATGSAVIPTAGSDTVAYFDSQNRFRDLAFAPNGKDIFVVMDKNSASSGPTEVNNPGVPACAGCVFKYTFLGYNDASGKSSIPTAIDIATSTSTNTILNGTTVTIDATNNNLWVPITGPDGNILAEIKANGNNLGTVTSTFYLHSGTMREDANKRLYLNRSITITPQNQPTSAVNIRLYITSAELTQISTASNSQGKPSQVSSIGNIKILKNNDANSIALTSAASVLTTTPYTHAGTSLGGYVLQADITSFSSFYFGNPSMSVLPLELVSFKATAQEDAALLNWETEHEFNTDKFSVERSIDGRNFEAIGEVKAKGETSRVNNYSFVDQDASQQASLVYYRLRMIDKDGGYQYSKVVTVSFNNLDVNIYPNPIKNVLNIQLKLRNSEEVKVVISDMQGRVVYADNKIVRAGTNEIQVNTSALTPQSYTVQVRDKNDKLLLSRKIVKR